jgi:kynureninase
MDRRCGAEPAAVPAADRLSDTNRLDDGSMKYSGFAQRAAALDAADPLAPLRERFVLPRAADGSTQMYFCGHSLGLAPRDARARVAEEIDDWENLGVTGHHAGRRPWIDYAELLRPALARLTGAQPDEVVAMNGLTVNLHLLMASFYRPQGIRRCIVIEKGAFPSDRHAVLSQLHWHGIGEEALIEVGHDATGTLDESVLEHLLATRGEEIALVLWPGVQYLTGQAFDLARIVRAAHAAGARCGFDLAHAVGNVPLALHDIGADFAAWCSYKYLNAGPGAVGGAFVHASHPRSERPGLAGWWGHDPATRFRMGPEFVPAAGAAAWQLSNPPILSTAPLLASLELFEAAGTSQLQAKAQALGSLLLEAVDALDTRIHCITPRDAKRRGCQLSLRVRAGRDAGRRLFEFLEAHNVVADWREPDIVRVAPVPLYNSFTETARLGMLLHEAMEHIG